ncbi:hypothetical protein OHA79_09435 [Streptomyces sp. NBC_00841]|nr:hypothetical protein [Streptomyces sp. NBC_00841]WRZ98036.1 hypothetical protein OHA79_09435 [Streptomyces sp. NBC_00841]
MSNMARRSKELNYGHKGRGSRIRDRIAKHIAKRREERCWISEAEVGK